MNISHSEKAIRQTLPDDPQHHVGQPVNFSNILEVAL